MERCPCCNARLREQPTRPRCKADFSPLINSEQAAKYCLSKAMDYWAEGNIEQGISTLKQSLALKKTQAAEAFLGFIIDQSHKDVLERLATQDILSTKKKTLPSTRVTAL